MEFVAACQSYKHDSCLPSFPPMFYKDGVKDISYLLEILDQYYYMYYYEILDHSHYY